MFDGSIYLTIMGLFLAVWPVWVVKSVHNYFGIQKTWKELVISRWSIFLLIALFLPMIWQFVPHALKDLRWVNFIQHGVGGGVAVALGCLYMIENFKDKLDFFNNRIFQMIFIFACVSSLGVLNEILEFTFDALRIGIYSNDRYDTWFDLVANSIGALLTFAFYQFLSWPVSVYKHFRQH
jgi:hypothetical protein